MIREDNAQLYTVEGIVASILMLMVVIFVVRGAPLTSNTASSSSKNVESQLETIGQDLLTILDFKHENSLSLNSPLKESIVYWDGSEIDGQGGVSSPKVNITVNALQEALGPAGIAYNLELRYYTPLNVSKNCISNKGVSTRKILWNGNPSDNSVTVSKELILHDGDNITASAIVCDVDSNTSTTDSLNTSLNTQYYNNVNVRLTLWRV
jgi:hypothetical protein